MRWHIRTFLAFLLIWAIYFLSPYVSLYGLGKAVEAKDTAAIEQRVNFRAVRVSVAKQLIPAYLKATGREGDLNGAKGQVVTGLGASIADPLIAQYLSPEALAKFLSGSPVLDRSGSQAEGGGGGLPSGIGIGSLHDAWRIFATAQTRGFRAVAFLLPVGKPENQQFRLQMRLSGLSWRLVGVELPPPVLQRLVQELIKSNPGAS